MSTPLFGRSTRRSDAQQPVLALASPVAEPGRVLAQPIPSATPPRAPDGLVPLATPPASAEHRQTILERIQDVQQSAVQSISISEQRSNLAASIDQIIVQEKLPLGRQDSTRIRDEIVAEMIGYGPIESLLADETISEIMVNGPHRIFVERNGRNVPVGLRFSSEQTLERICKKMAAEAGRTVDTSRPICNTRLPTGERVNIVLKPIAVDGPYLSIRKFRKEPFQLADLERMGVLTQAASKVLRVLVRCRSNLVVSGGTAAGKTSLLNSVSLVIDDSERLAVIEDVSELMLQNSNLMRHEARPAGIENNDRGAVTIQDLCINAMRQKPDRIILGEVRDGSAREMIYDAMGTGHPGSLCTTHADTPKFALTRLESLIRTNASHFQVPSRVIRQDIAQAVEIIVQTKRLPSGKRIISHITEVLPVMETDTISIQDLFLYDYSAERLIPQITGKPRAIGKAEEFGLHNDLLNALKAGAQ